MLAFNFKLEVIPPINIDRADNENDLSLLTDVSFKDFRFLSTGDITGNGWPGTSIKLGLYKVIKIPHHGCWDNFNNTIGGSQWSQVEDGTTFIISGHGGNYINKTIKKILNTKSKSKLYIVTHENQIIGQGYGIPSIKGMINTKQYNDRLILCAGFEVRVDHTGNFTIATKKTS